MPLIDLSHTIEENMTVFPGAEAPRITVAATVSRDGFLENRITLLSHTGTHVDAPAHLVEGGKTLDQLPLSRFSGSACVIDLRDLAGLEITPKDLESRLDAGRRWDFYLLHTGWSLHWGAPDYFNGYPVLSPRAARFLADLQPKGIGLDAISVDAVQADDLPVHKVFLGQDTVIIENLKNLERLPKVPFKFYCFPLGFRGADGSPVRAVAEVP